MRHPLVAAVMDSPKTSLGFRLSYLANFFTGPVYREVARTHRLSRSEFVVLLCLKELGALTAKDICALTGRPKNSISQAIAKLARLGHLSRVPDPADARRSLLKPTRRGVALCARIVPKFSAREADMLAPLTRDERRQFGHLLVKLTRRDDEWAALY